MHAFSLPCNFTASSASGRQKTVGHRRTTLQGRLLFAAGSTLQAPEPPCRYQIWKRIDGRARVCTLGCRIWDERDDGHWLPGGGRSQRLLIRDPAFANLVGDTVEMHTVASLTTVANGAFANPKWQPLLETALSI